MSENLRADFWTHTVYKLLALIDIVVFSACTVRYSAILVLYFKLKKVFIRTRPIYRFV